MIAVPASRLDHGKGRSWMSDALQFREPAAPVSGPHRARATIFIPGAKTSHIMPSFLSR